MIEQSTLFEAPTLGAETYSDPFMRAFGLTMHPGWPDRFGQGIRGWLQATGLPKIQTLSLFSGGGGLDIGFVDAGFHSVQMVELEPKYVATLGENAQPGAYFEGSQPICMDIRMYTPPADLNVDFIIGGPPCQSFSAAGRRAAGVAGIDDPRGILFAEYVRLVHLLRPRGFLFENVYGITGAQNGEAWKEIQRQFQSLGYVLSHRVIDAADYGVPQHRERLIVVGLLDQEFLFPEPTHGPDAQVPRPYYSAGQAVQGAVIDDAPLGLNGQYGHLLRDIPPGLNYSFYTEKMGHPHPVFGWRSKFSDFLYKADPDVPVRTIKAQGGQYTGPFSWENRPFSIAEYKRLQTFPDTYRIIGGRQKSIEQIGNSVPPQLARMFALSILDQVFDYPLPFRMRYLLPHQKLHFRQRKRQKTVLYRIRADDALEAISPAPSCIAHVSSTTTHRWLGASFTWGKQPIHDGVSVALNFRQQETEWDISATTAEPAEKATFQIEVRPAPGMQWSIPARRVHLHGQLSPAAFTGCWKFFEEMVMASSHIADLVQLNNYYQYKPRMQAAMQLADVPLRELGKWQTIQKIVNGQCRAKQLSGEVLAAVFTLPEEDVLDALLFARKLGYEVRNHSTNPQITQGYYLIPYLFPTLTYRSVQLRKSLKG